VWIEVHGFAGSPLTVIARDDLGHAAQSDSEMALIYAETQPLTAGRLREHLGRLGGTPFRLADLKSHLEGELLLPVSELNRLRRVIVQQLEHLRAQPKRWTERGDFCSPQFERVSTAPSKRPLSPVLSPSVGERGKTRQGQPDAGTLPLPRLGGEGRGEGAPYDDRFEHTASNVPAPAALHLIVLVRNLPQLEATLQSHIETIYCEFEDPKKYREAVSRFRNSAFRTPHSALFVAPPRIFKTREEWTLKQVRSCEADGYLVRNYDHLKFFADDRRIGDFSLNIANSLAADYFKNQFGLERLTASYDLNSAQLEALLQDAPPEWFEVTIHQHMPMFHMEHCVFCAFLSSGTDYTNCGRPCDHHELKLRDRVGAEHPVKADVGCRNTVFNSRAQSGADCVPRLIELGLRHFRLEFLNETPEQVCRTIASYQKLLSGEISAANLWREVKALQQLGVTRTR
jgi:putative protease